jgi:hypothetical protein
MGTQLVFWPDRHRTPFATQRVEQPQPLGYPVLQP